MIGLLVAVCIQPAAAEAPHPPRASARTRALTGIWWVHGVDYRIHHRRSGGRGRGGRGGLDHHPSWSLAVVALPSQGARARVPRRRRVRVVQGLALAAVQARLRQARVGGGRSDRWWVLALHTVVPEQALAVVGRGCVRGHPGPGRGPAVSEAGASVRAERAERRRRGHRVRRACRRGAQAHHLRRAAWRAVEPARPRPQRQEGSG